MNYKDLRLIVLFCVSLNLLFASSVNGQCFVRGGACVVEDPCRTLANSQRCNPGNCETGGFLLPAVVSGQVEDVEADEETSGQEAQGGHDSHI